MKWKEYLMFSWNTIQYVDYDNLCQWIREHINVCCYVLLQTDIQ